MFKKRVFVVSALFLATTGMLGAGVANAQTGGGSQPGYCSPATGCAGNDANGNAIAPQSQAPDDSTVLSRLSCGGGVATALVSSLATGGVSAGTGIGTGLTVLGCHG